MCLNKGNNLSVLVLSIISGMNFIFSRFIEVNYIGSRAKWMNPEGVHVSYIGSRAKWMNPEGVHVSFGSEPM